MQMQRGVDDQYEARGQLCVNSPSKVKGKRGDHATRRPGSLTTLVGNQGGGRWVRE